MIPEIDCVNKCLPPPYSRVSAEARLCIGLKRYSNADNETISEILGLTRRELSLFWEGIRRHPLSKKMLLRGLAAMYGESIPEGYSVQCNGCQHWIVWVPCVSCCDHRGTFIDRTDRRIEDRGGERIPPIPAKPTFERPGSEAKKAVMAYRLQTGFQLHHPSDTRLTRD